jgi:acetyl-CoA C-acetyltransferase
MKEVVIVDGVRTPHGLLGGALKDFPSAVLAEIVLRGLVKKTGIALDLIDQVIFGCALQTSDSPNLARVAALKNSIPIDRPAYTVQRNCASGMQSIVSAYHNIICQDADVQIAGGTESMSCAPYISRDMRFGKRLRNSQFIDSLWEGLTDPVCKQLMGRTAENLAEEFNISRQEQDDFSLLSHKRALKAAQEKKFKDEIIPIKIERVHHGKKISSKILSDDEGPNPSLTQEMLSQYPPTFKEDGTVTSGNSSYISDGASCVLIMSAQKAKELGFKPSVSIRAYGFAGVEPERMGIGPVKAAQIALKKAGLKLKDIQLIELNESFAAQYLACEKTLGLNREITNVNGGAIAIGHPVGETGCRIVITLFNEMKKRNLSLGLATVCVGGGQGAAIILERK